MPGAGAGHRAGEKPFVDYARPTVEVKGRRTGDIHEAKVFVGVLAATRWAFAELRFSVRFRYIPLHESRTATMACAHDLRGGQ